MTPSRPTAWVRAASVLVLLAGLLLWLYAGLLTLLIVDCETGGACLLA